MRPRMLRTRSKSVDESMSVLIGMRVMIPHLSGEGC